MLPPIGAAGTSGRQLTGWEPPPPPSQKQIGAASRLVLGDRASKLVEYQHTDASIKPRVEIDDFVQAKEKARERRFTNTKAISAQVFDPFA